MDRFSEAFNDVDPETGRPFSSGHPDGVWMISIVYGFLILGSLASIAFGIWKIFSSDLSGYMMVITGTASVCIFSLTIFFLFKRSVKAITMSAIIVTLVIISALWSLYSGADLKYHFLALACMQVYIFIYTLGLAKDNLLN